MDNRKLSKSTIGKFAGESMAYGDNDYLTPADVDRLLQNVETTDKELLTDEEIKQLLVMEEDPAVGKQNAAAPAERERSNFCKLDMSTPLKVWYTRSKADREAGYQKTTLEAMLNHLRYGDEELEDIGGMMIDVNQLLAAQKANEQTTDNGREM